MDQPSSSARPPLGPLLGEAARGQCPSCGAPTLFDGPVRFAARCRACGLDYSQFNVGDGPAAFLTLIVGTWSYIDPALIGSTVWRHFGADYGYFPLFQPLLGLLWLFWPVTLAAYGIRKTATPSTDSSMLKANQD